MTDQDATNGTPGPGSGVTRRQILGGAVLFGAGAATGGLISGASESPTKGPQDESVAFHGRHQAGITTKMQECLAFAALDTEPSATTQDLREMLETWSRAAATITTGQPYLPQRETENASPVDGGEVRERGPAQLTITIGFGPSLFEAKRFRLAAQGSELQPLPTFVGEKLQGDSSDGDLCIQACADDPQVAFHAIHLLARLAQGTAKLRWMQLGFGRTASTTTAQLTPRNLMGFKDGTENLKAEDTAELKRSVWVGSGDDPSWMRDGTYLVARRIAIKLDGWDELPLQTQEKVIGRRKGSGAPLGRNAEFDALDLDARASGGEMVIPEDAHVRLANSTTNGGIKILRRGYSYSDPTTLGQEISAGLFFISFQRSISNQFVPMQTRLSNFDRLNQHTVHTASAVFAVPPGTSPGGFVGEGIFS